MGLFLSDFLVIGFLCDEFFVPVFWLILINIFIAKCVQLFLYTVYFYVVHDLKKLTKCKEIVQIMVRNSSTKLLPISCSKYIKPTVTGSSTIYMYMLINM